MEGTGSFFDSRAPAMARAFRRKGLRCEQRHLRDGILSLGRPPAEVLEVGCGVGGLHLSLLQTGAGRAMGFDLCENMIRHATQLAGEMGLRERTRCWHGDFVALHQQASPAEATVLDKVLCCHENAQELIVRSTARTRHVYAVSYPRDRLFVRCALRAGVLLAGLLRCSCHPFHRRPGRWRSASPPRVFASILKEQLRSG